MVRILGIDPGSNCTGYGIVEIKQSTEVLVTFGQIRTQGEDLSQKLWQIFSKLQEIISSFQPTEAAIEEIFVQHNVRSALKLGQARGAALTACAAHALETHEYTARAVKQAIVGYGQASKQQVQHMVSALLHIHPNPPTDAADALAIALTHAHTRRWKQRTAQRTHTVT